MAKNKRRIAIAILGLAVAAAHAELVPAPCDHITGGGNFLDDTGSRAAFSASLGCRDSRLVGQLAFRDEARGIRFRSVALTAWLADPRQPELREACGIGVLAGAEEPVVFRARFYDYADPGRVDKFGIVIEDYRLMPREVRNPGGGNLQRHAEDGTGSPAVDLEEACGGLDPP